VYPRVCPEAAEKKKLLLLPGIELQFLGLLVSNLVIILIDLPRTLSVDTKPCIIVRIRFLEKGKLFFLVRKWILDKIAGGVQKWVLGLLTWGKAAGV